MLVLLISHIPYFGSIFPKKGWPMTAGLIIKHGMLPQMRQVRPISVQAKEYYIVAIYESAL